MADKPWTPEMEALLFRLWNIDGLSASMCARQFEGRTRNSIIGKVYRMGWSRPNASEPGTHMPYPKRISAPKIERKTGRGFSFGSQDARSIGQRKTAPGGNLPVDIKPTDIESPNAKVWTARTHGECAFPVDGEGADTISCCNATGGGTYCAGHRAILFNGSPPINQQTRKAYAPRERTFEAWLAA